MKTKVFLSLAISIIFINLIILTSISVAVDEPKLEGLIDVDYPNAGLAKVEVNLAGDMISAVIKSMQEKSPKASEAGEFLADIKSIKVRVYDKSAMKDKTSNDFIKFYENQLEKGKWNTIVRVNNENTKVGVYSLKSKRNYGALEEYTPGLTVIVGTPEQVIAVNIAGDIDVAKLTELSKMMGNGQDLTQFLGKDFLPEEKEKTKESEQGEKSSGE